MTKIYTNTAISLKPGQSFRKDSRYNWREAEEVANLEGKKAHLLKSGQEAKTPVHYILVNREIVLSPYQDIQIKEEE